MNKQNKEPLLTQQPQLDQLLATNKTLACQKRQFHRQKLRAYSQKAVKLRSILRQTTDGEEKRCLQEKLKALQEKQDAQITKLAKIDQIQKQIDQFISEDDVEGDLQINNTQQKNIKNQNWFNEIQNTPADRLRTKSSIPARNGNQSNSQKLFDFSRKKSNVCQKQDIEQLLLKDSRQALEELSSNHNKKFQKHRENSKNSVKSKQVIEYFSSYKKSDSNIIQNQRNLKQTKPFQKQQDYKVQQKINFDSVPPIFLTFVDKVSKFWPKDLEQLIRYFKEGEFNRKKLTQKQKQFDSLSLREQKIKKDEDRIRKDQSKLKNAEQKLKIQQQRVKGLISQERKLMENIDKLQKQNLNIKKQIDSSFQALIKSTELISSSSFMINQSKDPIQTNCLHSDSIHKFSVDSFDSVSQGSLYSQLCKFQKGIQKYLLSAQRAVMMVSGQMQQNNSKFLKAKQQHANLEYKKKTLQSQLSKLENSICGRKNLLKQLQSGLNSLQSQIKDNNEALELKKAISKQLQQKCEKLKARKKNLSEKIKKLQEQLQTMTFKKQQLFGMTYEAEQRLAGMKNIQNELSTKFIFCQRDRNNRLKDLEQLQKKQVDLISLLQQKNSKYEEVCLKYKQKWKIISEYQQKIKQYQQQQIIHGEKAQKLQQQLVQASAFLQQQNLTAQKQMQQISKRSQQHLEIQTKITQSTSIIREHQATIAQLLQQVEKGEEQMTKIENARQQLEKIIHQIMQKKQWMLTEIQQRSKQLEILLTDMENAKDDYHVMLEKNEQLGPNLSQKQKQLKNTKFQIDELEEQLEGLLQQQSNILSRINQLKEFQKSILLQIGVKGNSDLLQGQLKARVIEAATQLSTLNDLKNQLKQYKYENRKLRAQNQRMNKLLGQKSIE